MLLFFTEGNLKMQKRKLTSLPENPMFVLVQNKHSDSNSERKECRVFFIHEGDTGAVSERPVLIGQFVDTITQAPESFPAPKGWAERLYLDCANSDFRLLTEEETASLRPVLTSLAEKYPNTEKLLHYLE